MYANYTEVQRSGVLKKGLNTEFWMWIRTSFGNSAGDIYWGDERKTQISWIQTALKSPTTPCKW